jgi:hypothetical protein
MKIGVAIPCYINHIKDLFILLDSIENQTILPDKVVVSCSSTRVDDFNFELIKKYTFPLQVITNENKLCASKNRNIAANNLTDMDYITFIDADDIMHPQRIEILTKVFNEHNSDIILHNYYTNIEFNKNLFTKIDNVKSRYNSLKQCYSGCITHNDNHYYTDYFDKIHHGHVSIKQSIFNVVQFPEEPEFYTKEDCVFCFRVFSLPNVNNSYIANELTYYKPSNTQILYFKDNKNF